MMHAYFDADGLCTAVGDMPIEIPPGGAVVEVPDGTLPHQVWFDGHDAQPVESGTVELPAELEIGSLPFTLELPAGAVAIVNGERQKGEIVIDRSEERGFHIVIRGRIAVDGMVRVLSYAAQRQESYPPSGDQLDVLWKAMRAIAEGNTQLLQDGEVKAMLDQIAAVKADNPKPDGAE